MTDSWHSYPKVYNLGHRAIAELLEGNPAEIVAQEKVDGSQFSFGRFGDQLRVRSRGAEFDPGTSDKLFKGACEYVQEIARLLHDGWTYRGEVLCKPKHNTLEYQRTPKHNVILFDVNTAEATYLGPAELAREADRLDLESVGEYPVPRSPEDLKAILATPSLLGGAIEGVVIKNYGRFGVDGKALMGKHVSEAFKEVHQQNWRENNATGKDIKEKIFAFARSERRWEKAVERLRDDGKLNHEPKDIAALVREIQRDVTIELAEPVQERLWDWIKDDLQRACVRGFAEWYKDRLAASQFQTEAPPYESPGVDLGHIAA